MPQPKKAPKTRKVARDSGTGEWVKKSYAEKHKRTTEEETIKVPKPKRKKAS
jgi:hypothetical protein